jgi:hypothetical protein
MGGDGRPGGSGRGDAPKADWCCKFCTAREGGGAYKNFGHRSSCNRCKVDKGKAFLKLAPSTARAPTTSLAERQTADAKRSQKDHEKEIRALKAQLAVAIKQKKPWGMPEEVEEEPEEDLSKGLTLDQLVKGKAYWDTCGEAGKHQADALAVQIASIKSASLASMPVHVQLQRAHQRVEKAKTAVGKHSAKGEAIRVAQAAVTKDTADFMDLRTKELQELADAEAVYAAALSDGHGTSDGAGAEKAPEVPSAAQFTTKCLAFSDDFWSQSGRSKVLFQDFMDGVALEEKNVAAAAKTAAEAKVAADAKAAAAAAAAAAKEQARLAAEKAQSDAGLAASLAALPLIPHPDAAPSGRFQVDDIFMGDFIAGLGGVELDPALVKRAVEEANDKEAKRRKLLKK